MPFPEPASEDYKTGMLDGLRGLMALWVVLGHSCLLTGFHFPLLDQPSYAVDGFMMLSGFLMTYHYILRKDKEPWNFKSTWTAFWTRRFFRLSPLYYLLLVPTYLLMPLYVNWRAQIDSATGQVFRFAGAPPVDWKNVLLHVSYLFGLVPAYSSSLTIPDWSLSLEMQFYFAFPFLMLLAARVGWLWFSGLASVIWIGVHFARLAHYFGQPSPLYVSLSWFLIGMVWGSHFFSPSERGRYALLGRAIALLSLNPFRIVIVWAFAIVIFSGHPVMRKIQALLSGGISRFLADASYSVYLVHLLILTPVAFYLLTQTHYPAGLRFAIAAAVTVICAYSCAKPLEVIEQLGHNLGKKLAARQRVVRISPPVLVGS